MKYIITLFFVGILSAWIGYYYRVAQLNEHGTHKEILLSQEIERLKKGRIADNERTKERLIKEMLQRLAELEGGNSRLDGAGELNYGNDPIEDNFSACSKIGGWRLSECDTWTKYRWSIATAQHFHKLNYGVKVTEKDMLIKLLDDNFLDTFTADTIINNQGAIWHWHGAKKEADYFKSIIPIIREL